MIEILLFSILVALGNVAGGALVLLGPRRNPLTLNLLVAFGAGFMLSVAILEMMPHAMDVEFGLAAVLGGYLAVHLTQHTVTPHFHFGEETHDHAMVSPGVGVLAVIGLAPHAFFDGVAIASGYLQSPELGLLIVGAVLLHKLPAGLSLASIMLASGNSRRRAFLAVVGIGAATVLGAVVTPAVGLLSEYGLAIAAGVTIYVAASNLIPESQRQPGWLVPGGVFLGVVSFYLATLLLPGH